MKLHVLQIIPTLGIGGAERLVVNLAKFIDRSNFKITVVSLYDNNSSYYKDVLVESGIKLYELGKVKGVDVRIIWKLTRLFNELAPDVVHTHLYSLKYAALATMVSRVKPAIVHTLHNIAEKESYPLERFVRKLLMKFIKIHFVGVSEEVSEGARKMYKVEIRTIYNGIPLNEYKISDREWRIREGFDKDDFLIVNIGRLSPQKNQELLIRAFKIVAGDLPNVKLLIVGDGELRENLKNLARDLGIEEKVRFLGIRSDIPQILNASDLFVLSSNYEGLVTVVIEAMAAGLPVISTNVPGVRELVKDGETGILVPPKNVKALSDAIIKMVKDEGLRKRISKNAAEFIEKFDIRNTVREYEKLYEELVVNFHDSR